MNKQIHELKRIRRKLHRTPEIGFNTSSTLNIVKECIGKEPDFSDGNYGVFYLPGNETCIAFRCELDGLPIKETNTHDYISINENMHACGHDAHMAICILTMKYFMNHEHKPSLVFIFQNAEESGGGAKKMIEDGLFEKYKIDELYACHVMPKLGNVLGCKEGVFMAQSCEFKVLIEGKSGHVANRHTCIDALKAMNHYLSKIYELETQENILHVGKCVSGEVCNQVARSAILEGTVRAFDSNVFEKYKQFLSYELNKIDAQFDTKSQITFSEGYPCLINDASLVSKLKKICDFKEVNQSALSEDFAFYTQYTKCCYYYCGLTSNIDLHSSNFDLNEEECLKAIDVNIQLVCD